MKINKSILVFGLIAIFLSIAVLAVKNNHEGIRTLISKHFQLLDTNSDGTISKDEFLAASQIIFLNGDTSKDGVLSQQELLEMKLKEAKDLSTTPKNVIMGYTYFFPVFSALLVFALPILHILRFKGPTISLFIIAIAITSWWLAMVSPFQYVHDIDGHWSYIEYIYIYYWLPDPLGWQQHQAPLFYITAAIGSKIANVVGLGPAHGARFVASLYYYGFAITSAVLLRYCIQHRGVYLLSLALVLFWPSSAHTSVKITNDVPAAFFCLLTFLFCLRYVNERAPKFFGFALMAAGAAIATKGSGLVAIAMVAVSVVYMIATRRISPRSLHNRYIYMGMLVLILGLSCSFGRIIYWNITKGEHLPYVMNRTTDYLGGWEDVDNRPDNYVYFMLHDFLTLPHIALDKSAPSSHMFWNVALKSLLFSEFASSPKNTIPAQFLNLLFLAYLFCILKFSIKLLNDDNNIKGNSNISGIIAPTVIAIILALLMVMSSRIQIHVICQASSRYIYFIVTLLAALYGIAIEAMLKQGKPLTAFLIMGIGIAMVTCSLIFIIIQLQ